MINTKTVIQSNPIQSNHLAYPLQHHIKSLSSE
jgi:hypothetical protein